MNALIFWTIVLGRAGVWGGLLMGLFAVAHVADGTAGPWALLLAALAVAVTGAVLARQGVRAALAAEVGEEVPE